MAVNIAPSASRWRSWMIQCQCGVNLGYGLPIAWLFAVSNYRGCAHPHPLALAGQLSDSLSLPCWTWTIGLTRPTSDPLTSDPLTRLTLETRLIHVNVKHLSNIIFRKHDLQDTRHRFSECECRLGGLTISLVISGATLYEISWSVILSCCAETGLHTV